MEFRNKKIVVFGAGKSGLAAARYLMKENEVLLVDDKVKSELPEVDQTIKSFFGNYDLNILDGVELMVISPGIALTHKLVIESKNRGIPILSELELGYQLLKDRSIIAVTGTNGKTTTVAMTSFLLNKGGLDSVAAGNIGSPITGLLLNDSKVPNYLVLEVSSYQLETIDEFRPRIAAILNITPDHLDRHKSIGEYADAKVKIFKNMKDDDVLIVNGDDKLCLKIADQVNVKVLKFSSNREVEDGIFVKNNNIFIRDKETENKICSADEIFIKGKHNLENALVAVLISYLMGADSDKITNGLREFKGVEHRLEFVCEYEGVAIYNDSKSTNTVSLEKGLESFADSIILIAGGRDVDGDFKKLRRLVAERVEKVILIGEAVNKIYESWKDVVSVEFAQSMLDAVEKAFQSVKGKNVILLSPGCKSFDMFKNFEHRGQVFKEEVQKLMKKFMTKSK